MTIIRTDFRPEIDGYAFPNDWNVNQAERDEIRRMVYDAVPTAAGIITPILLAAGPIILGVTGPLVAFVAPILPFILPAVIKTGLDTLSGAIADNSNGRCAGMAYSSVDYFTLSWALPRGIRSELPQHSAQGGTSGSAGLRDYIWARLLDSHRGNAARFISLAAMNRLFGDYGRSWVRDQVRQDLEVLRGRLLQGSPWPIGLLSAEAAPWESHVVVAIGYEQIGPHRVRIDVYDNKYPDEVRGIEVDASGQSARVSELTPAADPKEWAAFFCTSYAPQRPRPTLVATSPLTISPETYAGVRHEIRVAFTARRVGYYSHLPLHLCVGDGRWVYGEESGTRHIVPEHDDVPANLPITFDIDYPGTYLLRPMVCVWPASGGRPAYKVLPQAEGLDAVPIAYRITPRIPIVATSEQSNLSSCRPVFVEGETVTMTPRLGEVLSIGVAEVLWRVTGAVNETSNAQVLRVALPSAPATIRVDLEVVLADGTVAYGSHVAEVMNTQAATQHTKLCEAAHIISTRPFDVRPIDPLRAVASSVDRWADIRALLMQPATIVARYESTLDILRAKLTEIADARPEATVRHVAPK